MFDCELRPGSQHCQNGTPDFLRKIMDSADARGIKLLFRMDSGNDSDENALLCQKRKHHYIIARNPRRSDQSEKIEEIRDFGRLVEDDESHTTHLWTDVAFIKGENGGLHKEYIVYRLKTIFKDKEGQPLLIPEEELSSWRTDMAMPEEDVIETYNQHGTSEQYHSELKSDMEMERMPSLSFESNKVVHACCMIAFNVLRKIGVDSAKIIRTRTKRSRLRIATVINEVMRSAGKFVARANTFFLRMNPSDVAFHVVHKLYYAYG